MLNHDYIKQALVTDFINETVGHRFEYGQHDCNLQLVKLVDILTGSEHYQKLHQNYSCPKTGFAKSKKEIGFADTMSFIENYFDEEETPSFDNGTILVFVQKSKNKKTYHVALVYSGYALAVNDRDVYQMIPVSMVEFESSWSIKKCQYR
ncbi:hypothetical protein NGC32_06265 [Kluyvera cryocrescens]|uniref:DUF6950 family protein n=1 Tax=Kluyvera cryocrescens TaxID=580 RepID=UPI002DB7A243|nr:hypothetical protein [Kluyvera cryocrescens]MEB7712329.1 hypothetical protein [Kluyvera cryocrescens]